MDKEVVKRAVISKVFGDSKWKKIGKANYSNGTYLVHIRYCSPDRNNSPHYKFSIYPSTLNADFDVWVCGDEENYYLLPQNLINQLYNEPTAYVDSHHPEARVLSIFLDSHTAMYATGGSTVNLRSYFQSSVASPLSDGFNFHPEEIDDSTKYFEGATKQVLVNAYERNPKARSKCIEHYGDSCSVCNFNFADKFGKMGEGFIHVHHLKPLSQIDGKYQLDPIRDLVPVCPNCHAMLHKKSPPFTINELRKIQSGISSY